jgi:iron complex outermembrane receptor protein
MLKYDAFPILLISTLTIFTFLEAKEINYVDITYPKLKNNDFNWTNLNDENAEFKIEKKQESFNYVLKSELAKYGYEDLDFADNYETSLYNEDFYKFIFSSCVYLYDDVWLNIDINYKDSLRSILDTTGNLAYKKKSIKQESIVRLFYKPNSIITSNISFENINNSLDYDKFTYKSYNNSNNNKFSFNVNTKFDFVTINSSFFQIIKDNNYTYRTADSDNYLQSTQELYRGVELSLSKILLDNLKVTTSGKITNMVISDSNLTRIIGKTPAYVPNRELNLKIEYLFKDVKFTSKVTHVGDRYSNSLNSDKLNSYTIESVGATFFTQLDKEDVKIELNIKNVLNKNYYIYSDTKGDARNYMMNISMKF